MDITWMEIVIISLASFRLTRLIVFDKITEFLRAPFFEEEIEMNNEGEEEIYYVPKKGIPTHFFGELLSCYWCTGVWSTLGICIFYFMWPIYATPILIVLAIAGVAAIIETVVQRLL